MTDGPDLSELLRDALPAHEAPARLHAWARAAAREAEAAAATTTADTTSAKPVMSLGRSRRWRSALYAAGLVAAALLGYGAHASRAGDADRLVAESPLVAELVDNHVESLVTGRLMDVRSSDQHTVKPWFAGKTDFAPRVPRLDSLGYPLLGGRLAYVEGRRTAVLVYGYRKHTINVFVWRRADAGASESPVPMARAGYSLVHWNSGGLTFWAIADTGPAELNAFRAAFVRE